MFLCLQVRSSLQEYTLEAQAERTADGRQAVKLRKDSKVTPYRAASTVLAQKARATRAERSTQRWYSVLDTPGRTYTVTTGKLSHNAALPSLESFSSRSGVAF
jgi:hypothetical protein